MKYKFENFENLQHKDQVISLWNKAFGYEADHNTPELVIEKKLEINDDLFFVATVNQSVVGTVMAGYDGHRGWIYAIAVSSDYKKQGLGSELLSFAEEKLLNIGCMKINLQIMEGNEAVEKFYLSNGYQTEKRISMGKRLQQNIKHTEPIIPVDIQD